MICKPSRIWRAWGLLIVSFLGLIATIVGAILLTASLIFSARATRAAVEAANAARDTLGSERAWVHFHDLDQEQHTDLTVRGSYFKNAMAFYIVWINTGRSPALEVEMLSDHKVIDRDMASGRIPTSADIPRFTPNIPNNNPFKMVLGQNRPQRSAERIIGDEELTAFMQHKKILCVYGYVRYRDVFQPKLSERVR
jgi:hypothetical protein